MDPRVAAGAFAAAQKICQVMKGNYTSNRLFLQSAVFLSMPIKFGMTT
jgi:hypothetical protein